MIKLLDEWSALVGALACLLMQRELESGPRIATVLPRKRFDLAGFVDKCRRVEYADNTKTVVHLWP